MLDILSSLNQHLRLEQFSYWCEAPNSVVIIASFFCVVIMMLLLFFCWVLGWDFRGTWEHAHQACQAEGDWGGPQQEQALEKKRKSRQEIALSATHTDSNTVLGDHGCEFYFWKKSSLLLCYYYTPNNTYTHNSLFSNWSEWILLVSLHNNPKNDNVIWISRAWLGMRIGNRRPQICLRNHITHHDKSTLMFILYQCREGSKF